MKVYSLYFSPTGGTKRVVDIFAEVLGVKEEIDLSEADIDYRTDIFQEEDICIIGVPSFGGRVPGVVLERLRGLKGNGARAVLIAVYGNRDYDDTLLELRQEAAACGFHAAAAVAAVAEHSIVRQYGQGRPDAADEEELRAFAWKLKALFEENKELPQVKVPGNTPYRTYEGVPLKPKATKGCIKCGICAKRCPVKAISAEDPSQTDSAKCISCMRCISICPVHARSVNKAVLMVAAQGLKKKCAGRKKNELFYGIK